VSGQEFVFPVRVYYEDTDSGGVVYYANYLRFFERARTEWLRALGFGQGALLQQHGVLFAVREAHVEYLRPARFDDLLAVVSRIHERGRSVLVFEQHLLRGEELLTRARIKVVCIAGANFKPVKIPEPIARAMEGHA
jgi:acyl-CoA thioester hydrolase